MLKIEENIPLKDLNTFRVGGKASFFSIVRSENDLREALAFAKSRKLPIFILGGGSNLLFSDHGFSGLIIKNEIRGVKFTDRANDEVILEVGAGEIIDEVVSLSVLRNLSGLENLSAIPGTIGGAIVQNAGAYGTEIKDCLFSVEGLNAENGKKFSLSRNDCRYGYRESLFKKNKKFIITAVTFVLNKKNKIKADYAGLKDLLTEKDLRLGDLREAVLKIRKEKLPDWHKFGTAGSFFKNIIISTDEFGQLKKKYPDLPGFPEKDDRIKVPLAWILDKVLHLNGFREGNVGLYEKQPLVLVNYGEASEKEINNFSAKIKKMVKEKIGVEIEEEVEKIK